MLLLCALPPFRNTDMWTTSCLRTTPSPTASWTSGGRRAVRGWDTCTAGTQSTKTSHWASEPRWLPSTSPHRSESLSPSPLLPPLSLVVDAHRWSLLCHRTPLRTAWSWWTIPKLQLWMKSLPNWACARLVSSPLAAVWSLNKLVCAEAVGQTWSVSATVAGSRPCCQRL